MQLIAGIKYALHEKSNKTRKYQSNRIKIESETSIECNIDGERLIANTFSIEVIPKGIQVYYNQELINKITMKG